uniref:Ig-like domain-containing protein n=1 Tax=Salarias fasciatus TaxID=181472 RepID=A0A672FQ07_SALFA
MVHVIYCFSSVHASTPPSMILDTPSFKTVMTATSDVKATCLISTVFDAKVTWLLNEQVAPSNTVSQSSNTSYVTSEVTVPSTKWKQLKHLTCRAEHACFSSVEKTKNITGKITFQPENQTLLKRLIDSLCSLFSAVFISQSLKFLQDSDSQTLSCSGSGFDPQIKWLPELQISSSSTKGAITMSADGRVAVTSRLQVLRSDWQSGNVFTCQVSDKSLNTAVNKSISVCSAPVALSEPSVLLLQSSNELVCLAFDFTPEAINITWFRDGTSELRDYNTSEPQRGADGRFSIRSHLRLSLIDFLPGVVFTCKVTHASFTKLLNLSRPGKTSSIHPMFSRR